MAVRNSPRSSDAAALVAHRADSWNLRPLHGRLYIATMDCTGLAGWLDSGLGIWVSDWPSCWPAHTWLAGATTRAQRWLAARPHKPQPCTYRSGHMAHSALTSSSPASSRFCIHSRLETYVARTDQSFAAAPAVAYLYASTGFPLPLSVPGSSSPVISSSPPSLPSPSPAALLSPPARTAFGRGMLISESSPCATQ